MTGSGDLKFGMAEARNTPYLNNYILNDSATIWTLKKKKKKKRKRLINSPLYFPFTSPLHGRHPKNMSPRKTSMYIQRFRYFY